jgi:hypothetical protein
MSRAYTLDDDEIPLDAYMTHLRILPRPYIPNDFLERAKTSPFEGLMSPYG